LFLRALCSQAVAFSSATGDAARLLGAAVRSRDRCTVTRGHLHLLLFFWCRCDLVGPCISLQHSSTHGPPPGPSEFSLNLFCTQLAARTKLQSGSQPIKYKNGDLIVHLIAPAFGRVPRPGSSFRKLLAVAAVFRPYSAGLLGSASACCAERAFFRGKPPEFRRRGPPIGGKDRGYRQQLAKSRSWLVAQRGGGDQTR
jgi:hypothetical protein